MFGELPKLLGRDFAVGYFLPAALLALAATHVAARCDPGGNALCAELGGVSPPGVSALGEVAVFLLAVWLLAIVLLGLNRSLYRFLEGYGAFNPLRLLRPLERGRYARLAREIEALTARARAADAAARPALLARRGTLLHRRAREFPAPARILPTRFGNAIRAFEDYPLTMYGIDDIAGWPRLLAVLPKDYVRYVDEAKAQVDFWVNVAVAAGVLLPVYALLSPGSPALGLRWWIPTLAAGVAVYALRRGGALVSEWGEMVKAAYDVFLPELRRHLAFPPVGDGVAERRAWNAFSLAITYRLPEKLPARSIPPPTLGVPATADVPAKPLRPLR